METKGLVYQAPENTLVKPQARIKPDSQEKNQIHKKKTRFVLLPKMSTCESCEVRYGNVRRKKRCLIRAQIGGKNFEKKSESFTKLGLLHSLGIGQFIFSTLYSLLPLKKIANRDATNEDSVLRARV